ncbi:hypothetical protein K3495_g11420 [Podosphaera aphanis]|nr:hypothetical protein K3495_g11420 [Podosphaera aphanis]
MAQPPQKDKDSNEEQPIISAAKIEDLYQEEFDPNLHTTSTILDSNLASQFSLDFSLFKETDLDKIRKENRSSLFKVSEALADIIQEDVAWPNDDPDRPTQKHQQENPPPRQQIPTGIHNHQHDNQSQNHGRNNLRTSQIHSSERTFYQNPPPLSYDNPIARNPPQMLPTSEEMIHQRFQTNQYSREVTTLLKMYQEDYKYGGEPTESFNYKFGLFIDLTNKANLPNEALPIAFSSMLRGIALEYYHSNFHGLNLSITELVHNFQNYFEGHEHRQNMLREWNSINLRSMWRKAPEKSKGLVFNEMVQHLLSIQRGLDREF